jgi:pimeloyl-ACP methyl ester carboxylesterase
MSYNRLRCECVFWGVIMLNNHNMVKKIVTSDKHIFDILINESHGNTTNAIIIMTHGIFTDKFEKGRFDILSNLLCENNFTTVRFDFRGHGDSHFNFNQFTVTGAVIDYFTVLRELNSLYTLPIIVIGSSFGGSIVLLCEYFNIIPIKSFVLINPVVDYISTFIKPFLNWGKEIFSDNAVKEIQRNGIGALGNGYIISDTFLYELNVFKPFEAFDLINNIPTIVFHGSEDDKVPLESAITHCDNRNNVKLNIIQGGGHAFKTDYHQNLVYGKILDWVKKL